MKLNLNTSKLSKPENTKSLLHLTTAELRRNKSITNVLSEAEILLCRTLGKDRAWLHTNPDIIIPADKVRRIELAVQQRLTGEPLEYIFKQATFCDLDFFVNKNVLIPRTETEQLVNAVIKYAKRKKALRVLDIGTGSGAIAIALSKKLSEDIKIIGTDISSSALKVAARNIKKHNIKNIQLIQSDLLDKIEISQTDIIVANLPYVPSSKCNGLADPTLALDGGENGTDIISRLLKQIHDRKTINTCLAIFLEIGHGQAKQLAGAAKNLFPESEAEVANDLAGYERVVKIVL